MVEEWNEERDETLVMIWRDNVNLYDTNVPEFKDRTKKARTMEQMARQLQTTGEMNVFS